MRITRFCDAGDPNYSFAVSRYEENATIKERFSRKRMAANSTGMPGGGQRAAYAGADRC